MSDLIVETRDLRMTYNPTERPVHVLRDVSLSIQAGTRVAIAGPSGSGKTSLLLLLSGLERPTAGQVLVDGVDLSGLDADGLADMRRDRIGIVFQSFHLLPSLSALDNVALPLQMTGTRNAREQAITMLDRVGLSRRVDHYPSQLSGGERQRAIIGRALAQQAPVLLLDEPTSALDLGHQQEVVLLLDRLRHEGHTIMTTMHDLTLAGQSADRLVMLTCGEVMAQGSAEQVLTEEHLADYYGADVSVSHIDGSVVVVPRPLHLSTSRPTTVRTDQGDS